MNNNVEVPGESSRSIPVRCVKRRGKASKRVPVKQPRSKVPLYPKKNTRVGPAFQADILDVLPNFIRHHNSNYLTCPAHDTLLSEAEILTSTHSNHITFQQAPNRASSRHTAVNSTVAHDFIHQSSVTVSHSTPLETADKSPDMCKRDRQTAQYQRTIAEVHIEAPTNPTGKTSRRKASVAYRFGQGYRQFMDDDPPYFHIPLVFDTFQRSV